MPKANAVTVAERNNLVPPHLLYPRPRHLIFRIRALTVSHSVSAPSLMVGYPLLPVAPFHGVLRSPPPPCPPLPMAT